MATNKLTPEIRKKIRRAVVVDPITDTTAGDLLEAEHSANVAAVLETAASAINGMIDQGHPNCSICLGMKDAAEHVLSLRTPEQISALESIKEECRMEGIQEDMTMLLEVIARESDDKLSQDAIRLKKAMNVFLEADRARVRESTIDECVEALQDRVTREEYGHAKAAVCLDIEALNQLRAAVQPEVRNGQ